MKIIYTSKGQPILVDDVDFGWLNQWLWYLDPDGYATRVTSDKPRRIVRMHRVILGVDDPRVLVDHDDRIPWNNQRYNLREATPSQNSQNKKRYKTNKSGFKGVTKVTRKLKKPYHATIMVGGKRKDLGLYETAEEAHEVYCLWADMLHKEFACHGN